MLKEISIKNFAIIDSLSIDFSQGLTVLTGETGAGKSIVIDAVGLLVGGRGQSDMIRTGSDQAIVQGLFSLPKGHPIRDILLNNGFDIDEDQLIIYRQINRQGGNNIRINNQLATLKLLTEIGELLVDIHGQFDHQQLLDQEQHIILLDQFAEAALQDSLKEYQTTFLEYQKVKQAISSKQKNQQEIAQRLDLLQFQKTELDQADLQPGEEEKLQSELMVANNYAKITEALTAANNSLTGGEGQSALDGLSVAMSQLQSIVDLDVQYKQLFETISSSYYGAQEASRDLDRILADSTFDQEQYDQINNRMMLINDLKRKYGPSFEDVLNHHQKVNDELSVLGESSLDEGQLKEQLQKLVDKLSSQAANLTTIRQQYASQLSKNIEQQFADMLMNEATFEVRVQPSNDFNNLGSDEVAFYIKTNVGEEAKQLIKIASGGELSRVMLSIKTIFAESSPAQTVVFDEIDTGVSGRVAQKIGEKERLIGQHLQVLSITHLPQVAAAADQQFLIEKNVNDNRTTTTLRQVTGQERIEAIAMMLSANQITETSLKNAQEMLEMNQSKY